MELASLIILGICFIVTIIEKGYEKYLDNLRYIDDNDYEVKMAELENEKDNGLQFKK